MNRRLHAPIIACTASAIALAIGLLAAGPVASQDGTVRTTPAASHAARTTHTDPARTLRVEPAPDLTGTPPPRSRSKRARSAIAMPYFSFARGAGGRS